MNVQRGGARGVVLHPNTTRRRIEGRAMNVRRGGARGIVLGREGPEVSLDKNETPKKSYLSFML